MLPILYTFRRCPYAIRARMALASAGIDYELREVVLRDKPAAMLDLSPKATVPVLLAGERVLDESLDVMRWALDRNDPQGWRDFDAATLAAIDALVARCDTEFKPWLDRYKYADRYPDESPQDYRAACERFLRVLEQRLAGTGHRGAHLFSERPGFADVAIFPFIRQFAFVDKAWFDASPYPALKRWLDALLASEVFVSVMEKHPPWRPK